MKQLTTIYEKIQHALNDLPGEYAHREMYPKRRSLSKEIEILKSYRKSAVLLLFYEDKNPKLILTQRQFYKGNHGGQVSFPGGKMEDQDKTPLETALRETYEEIGVIPAEVEIFGKLTDVHIPISRFLVHPYVGIHHGVPEFTPSEREVKEVITFDPAVLLDENTLQRRNIKTTQGLVLKNTPCFIIENKVVWGATALMLNELKHVLQQ